MGGVLPSVLLVFSLLLLFVAERIAGEGTVRDVLMWASIAGVAGAVGWRIFIRSKAGNDRKPAEDRLLYGYLGVVVSLVLYALSTDWGLSLMGLADEAADRTGGVFSVLFPAGLTVSLLTLFFTELAYRKMPVAIEMRRVQASGQSGLSLGLAAVFLFSVNYISCERDVKKDLSYFKTSRPSESTLNMVEQLGEPVKVMLFYPEVNEVLEQLNSYFDELDAASDQLTVERRDHALAPAIAREHHVRGNGFVVLLKGTGDNQQAEQFEVGTDLEIARSRLRTLDGRFQQAFAKLVRIRRELHMTAGHQERSAAGSEGDSPEQRINGLTKAIRRSNIEMRELGMAQGLGNQVPEGAPAVVVAGPRQPFLPEEARSLLRYVQHGGRVVVMVDPDIDSGLEPFLSGLGVEMLPGFAASETEHLRRTFSPADRGLIYTKSYSSHPTVTMASRNARQVATVFVQGGALRRADSLPEGVRVLFPIRSGRSFFRDLNGNWERDPNEPEEELNLMAAVTVQNAGGDEGRAVIIPDGDFVTDQVIGNPGNALVFGDIIQWFLGEEQIIGDTTSEEDIRIEHTRDEDQLWFWATSFGAPLPLLGLGVLIAVRRRRRQETHDSKAKRPGSSAKTAGGKR